MSDFIEINKKDTKIQDDISQTIEKYNKKSYATQSKIGKNSLIQSKVFKQAIEIMDDTISDMDIEIEQKDNKISFLENKIGVAYDKVLDEMNKLSLNNISNKEKNDRIMNKSNKTLNIHKYIKS